MARSRRLHPVLKMRWHGPEESFPMLGHLLATKRGRGAYRLLGVEDKGKRGDGQDAHTLLRLTVERIGRAALEEPGAQVHWFLWDRR